MNYSPIHEGLHTLSTAKNLNELISLSLDGDRENRSLSNKYTKQASRAIAELLQNHSQEINWIDRRTLERIHSTFNMKYREDISGNLTGKKSKKNLKRIEKAVSNTLQLTKKPAESPFPISLNPIKPLFEEFLTLDECMNLVINGAPPSDRIIQTAICNTYLSNNQDIDCFFNELKKWSVQNKNIFYLMANAFVRNASIEMQQHLFFYLQIGHSEGHPSDKVSKELRNIFWNISLRVGIHLDLSPFRSKKYCHGITSIIQSRNLKSLLLNLAHYRLKKIFPDSKDWPNISSLDSLTLHDFTHDDIKYLTEISGVSYLKELHLVDIRFLEIEPLQYETKESKMVEKIVNCTNFNHLKILHLNNCISGRLLQYIDSSANLTNLEQLHLPNNNLADNDALVIINSTKLKLKTLNLRGNTYLTDKTIYALIDRMNDISTDCPYRNTLQYVHLNGTGITGTAKADLNVLLEENRKKIKEQGADEYKMD